MPRKVNPEKLAQAKARVGKLEARLKEDERKRRTARLIALGVVLQQVLMHYPGMQLEQWDTAAARYLDERQKKLAREALTEIATRRSQSSPVLPDSRG